MKTKILKENKKFIGRKFEFDKISKIDSLGRAAIVVVYGRRRVGKTELIEQAFRNRNILKFEGMEGGGEKRQVQVFLDQLAKYVQDPLISKLSLSGWSEVFQLLAKYTNEGKWTIFLDELQWMASYRKRLISELKFVWDNYFKQNDQLILVLCGSSPSFMINKVIKSQALYNRSEFEIPLQEFSVSETNSFLSSKKRSPREVMDAYLNVGGVPEYLSYLNDESSVFLGLCKNSFTRGSFFSSEYERIFTSSLGSNMDYRKIISFLSGRKFATRDEIASHLKAKSGGGLSEILSHLEICGFITKYSPFNLGEDSHLTRFAITDQYLQFYFKFIHPVSSKIQNGDFDKDPTHAINQQVYQKWLGFSFERFCRKHHRLIARQLGFEAVEYQVGTFFDSSSKELPGFQIDLVFDRRDNVYTICEVKYLMERVSKRVIREFEEKLKRFPNPKKKTIQKVLITTEGQDSSLEKEHYFDRTILLEDIVKEE